jgi:crossover junction endodeoxyribonuclease RusA
MIEQLSFTVYCTPQPQGSAKGFAFKRKSGKMGVAITSDNVKLKPFRSEMARMAFYSQGSDSHPATEGPVRLELDFYFTKPKSAKKRVHHTVKPDLDKLARAALDSFTGILYSDDAQVCEMALRKLYGVPERVEVQFRTACEQSSDIPASTPVQERPIPATFPAP